MRGKGRLLVERLACVTRSTRRRLRTHITNVQHCSQPRSLAAPVGFEQREEHFVAPGPADAKIVAQ
jgi:hypothetical protein